ncbi:hypothetical protein HAX54_004334 [Datura stramonium]|uniref:Uncharacterized protein n=1 Tax=Datura stramonium TaxID=4076 RepID=A0ABS8RUC1_DATST|nr:hypothetical protein [Datura stramonium]
MEAFASLVGFAKSLEGKKQKRRVERDQNKKAGQPVGLAVQLVVEIKGCLVRGLQYSLSLHHRQAVVFQADIAKVMGASLARIGTLELQSLRVRVVLDSHPTKESLAVLADRAIQVLQLPLLQHLPSSQSSDSAWAWGR